MARRHRLILALTLAAIAFFSGCDQILQEHFMGRPVPFAVIAGGTVDMGCYEYR